MLDIIVLENEDSHGEDFAGVEITVEYDVEGADPDVGIMNDYIGDWTITHIDGVKATVEQANDLYERIRAAGEEDYVIDKCSRFEFDY